MNAPDEETFGFTGPENPWSYTQIRDWVMLNAELTHAQFRMYCVLRSMVTDNPKRKFGLRRMTLDQLCWLAVGAGQKPMGASTMRKILAALLAAGLIREQGAKGDDGSRLYQVIDPPGEGYSGWRNAWDKLDAYSSDWRSHPPTPRSKTSTPLDIEQGVLQSEQGVLQSEQGVLDNEQHHRASPAKMAPPEEAAPKKHLHRSLLSQAAPLPPTGGAPADAGRGGGGEERDHGGVEDPGVPDGGGPVGGAPSAQGGWPPVAGAGSGGGRSSRSSGSGGGGAPSFAEGFVSALYGELPGGLRMRLVRQVARLERAGWEDWQVLALLADDGALVRERERGRLVLSVLRDSEGLRPPSESTADRLWPDGWRQEPLQVLLEDVWDAFRYSETSGALSGAQAAVCGFPDCDVRLLPGDPPGGECASCSAMRHLGVTEMDDLYARWLCSDQMAWAGRRLAGEPVFGPAVD